MSKDVLRTVDVSHDSRYAAVAGAAGIVRVWDLKRRSLNHQFEV